VNTRNYLKIKLFYQMRVKKLDEHTLVTRTVYLRVASITENKICRRLSTTL